MPGGSWKACRGGFLRRPAAAAVRCSPSKRTADAPRHSLPTLAIKECTPAIWQNLRRCQAGAVIRPSHSGYSPVSIQQRATWPDKISARGNKSRDLTSLPGATIGGSESHVQLRRKGIAGQRHAVGRSGELRSGGRTSQGGVTPKGPALANYQGMTLYTFDKDSDGKSACTGKCAERTGLR